MNDLPLKSAARRNKHKAGVNSLGRKIRENNPKAILVVGLDIRGPVEIAVATVGWGPHSRMAWFLPCPAQGNRKGYAKDLVAVLKELRESGVLPNFIL